MSSLVTSNNGKGSTPWRLILWTNTFLIIGFFARRCTVDSRNEKIFDDASKTSFDEHVSSSLAAMMGFDGNVSECCSFHDIEELNIANVRPLLKKIVATPFFSHFKIDLCSECKLWDDQPMCILRDCAVCECDKPPVWAAEVDWMPSTDLGCEHMGDDIVTTVDTHISRGWQSDTAFLLNDSLDVADDVNGDIDENSENAVVVDLRLNPEQYTGYSGPSAEKVWSAIHSTNCFQSPPSQHERKSNEENVNSQKLEDPKNCLLPAEQQLYNRLISGLHSSISLHIANTYCLEVDQTKMGECKRWGTQRDIARDRVLKHPDRVENLYVAFALLLRAVVKAGEAVTAAVPKNDPFFAESLSDWENSLLPQLVKLVEDCPNTFDESSLPQDSNTVELQRKFQHLQQIMQCVGCERCKLWGTLQALGIATAMKVLYTDNDDQNLGGSAQLSRQEAVALVHTLERLSSSLVYAHDIQKRSEKNDEQIFR